MPFPDLHVIHFSPVSAERLAISMALDEGNAMMEAGAPPEDINAKILPCLGSIAGIEVIEEGDWQPGLENGSAHYTFGTRGGHTWAQPGIATPADLWNPRTRFLKGVGYRTIEKPRAGDPIAYGHQLIISEHYTHFGVFDGRDEGRPMAISKHGAGPLLRHPLGFVPLEYGSQAVYFTNRC